MAKKYYGFRYYSNRSCTYGSPNPKTGRYSIAGDVQVFRTEEDLTEWIDGEKLSAPCGLGGGERVRVSLKKARSLQLGMSTAEFEEMLNGSEFDRYQS